MSKPVTQDEVEDVLSSIRRLVSEDKRPLAGMRTTPPPEHPTPGPDETASRLVLTPALRVERPMDDPEPKEAPLNLGDVAVSSRPAPSLFEDAADAVDPVGPETPAQQERIAPDMHARAAHPDRGDQVADADPSATPTAQMLRRMHIETAGKPAISEDDAVPEAPFFEDQGEDAAAGVTDINARDQGAVEDIPVPSDTDIAAEKPVEAEADDTAPDFDSIAQRLRASGVFKSLEMPPQDDQQDTDPDNNDDGPALDASLTSKIAALETAIGSIRQEFEPDGDEAEDVTAPEKPSMAWEDDVELDARGAPLRAETSGGGSPENVSEAERTAAVDRNESSADEVDDPVALARSDGFEFIARAASRQDATEPEDASDAVGLDEGLMDEEALRDLVSEIVRAELQGALGERITRNVRKLVRREIHRALTAQELE